LHSAPFNYGSLIRLAAHAIGRGWMGGVLSAGIAKGAVDQDPDRGYWPENRPEDGCVVWADGGGDWDGGGVDNKSR